MSSIVPTIGRKVWYWGTDAGSAQDPKQAFDATVIFVHNPTCVNLAVTNHGGTSSTANSVQLLDYSDDFHGSAVAHATWMPYQQQQAAKATA